MHIAIIIIIIHNSHRRFSIAPLLFSLGIIEYYVIDDQDSDRLQHSQEILVFLRRGSIFYLAGSLDPLLE